ncbi:MAG TPA: prolipoprotein diacylglyceryl transferase family protein [Anaerolineales bacterium]|nr:prolipoprotein diacylglyceryl transferase family protein [Anaerolineales bacterium]
MFPYLRLGPLLLQTPGLALLIGVWLGLSLAEKESVKLSLKPDQVYNLIFFGLVSGLIGARLAYAARFLNAYLESPLSLFSINPNTLSPGDGLVIGLVVAGVYGWRKGLPLRPTLDALAPGLAAFMIALGVAHFLSGDAFGARTDLPWKIYLWNDYRHPTQVYEILLASGIFMLVRFRPLGNPGQGVNFLTVVALSAAARVFLEAFRGDSLIWSGGFRAAQIVGLVILAAALFMIKAWAQPQEPQPEQAQ